MHPTADGLRLDEAAATDEQPTGKRILSELRLYEPGQTVESVAQARDPTGESHAWPLGRATIG